MTFNTSDEITAWLDNAGRFPVLSPERVTLISRQIQSLPRGSRKRTRLVQKLVEHNLRLVVRYVKSFMDSKSHNRWGAVETVDYLQVGVIGLQRAAEMFDPARGYAFSTYANHWIGSTVNRYNLKTMTPVHVSESAARNLIFFRRNGYFPDHYRRENGKYKAMPEARARRFILDLKAAYGYISTDVPLEGGASFGTLIKDDRDDWQFSEFSRSVDEGLYEAGVSRLGRDILLDYYVDGKTNAQIAQERGISLKKTKYEKQIAMRLARRKPEAFSDGYNVLVPKP
jgi:RNA polymerase nonessential primary-like sigma factor